MHLLRLRECQEETREDFEDTLAVNVSPVVSSVSHTNLILRGFPEERLDS